ncbi:MAG TPA: hypothetical protein VND93_10910 [Myxococcales bacterium]|jgi:outer membrane protein|nr:hypothetical protein [Myxococcales bacterium]
MFDLHRWRWLAAACLLFASGAHAQFANRSIGFSGGYIQLNDSIVERGIPLGLFGSYYVEDGLEVVARLHGMIVTLHTTGTQAFAADGGLGVRYLFLQEQFRPYVGLELSYFQAFFENGGINYVGASPVAGFDVMLGSQLSVGPRGQVNVYWMLNRSVNAAFEVTLEVAAYF